SESGASGSSRQPSEAYPKHLPANQMGGVDARAVRCSVGFLLLVDADVPMGVESPTLGTTTLRITPPIATSWHANAAGRARQGDRGRGRRSRQSGASERNVRDRAGGRPQ